mgnify:CR=1 FL=1
MKTKNDIKELSFNDYAFFKGCSATEAKWEFAVHFYDTQKELNANLTKTGVPKIKVSDTVLKECFDFTMRSNSELDGKSQLDYLCDYYNKGITTQKLKEFS